jgi:hypothetical protein
MNVWPIVGLATRLVTRLAARCIASTVGVAGCPRVLRAVLTLLIVWFKGFLAFIRLARALI